MFIVWPAMNKRRDHLSDNLIGAWAESTRNAAHAI
jgi:hypothetical protein